MNQLDDRAVLHKRQCARRLALQAMYQWHLTNEVPENLITQYQEDEYWPKSDHLYFKNLITGSIEKNSEIDAYINNASDYTVNKIDPIELSALRIAIYEFMCCPEIPDKVIISEAIRLCKKFGSDEGYKLVNYVLDKLINNNARKQMLLEN